MTSVRTRQWLLALMEGWLGERTDSLNPHTSRTCPSQASSLRLRKGVVQQSWAQAPFGPGWEPVRVDMQNVLDARVPGSTTGFRTHEEQRGSFPSGHGGRGSVIRKATEPAGGPGVQPRAAPV